MCKEVSSYISKQYKLGTSLLYKGSFSNNNIGNNNTNLYEYKSQSCHLVVLQAHGITLLFIIQTL